MNAGLIALILSITPPIYQAPERIPEHIEQRSTKRAQEQRKVIEEKLGELSIKKAKQGLHNPQYRTQLQEWLACKAQELYQETEKAAIRIGFFSWQERVYLRQMRKIREIEVLERAEVELKEVQKEIKRGKQDLEAACADLREIPARYRTGPLPEACKEYLETFK